ncbi:MAG TPA: deoxyribonuclease IV [Streptosporangiaceae bacterium]
MAYARGMVRIGAHDREGDPLTVARATGSEAVQFFLGDPQGWGAPTFPGGDASALRAAFAEARVDVYIHAPYGINVASANNRIRIPSRKLLERQLAAAAEVGAKALIVHGGHVTGGVAERVGYDNWRKAVERIGRPVRLLIENTAGGDHAMARGLDAVARLWDAIGDLANPGADGAGLTGAGQIGFCLDTCHAYAGGDELATIVDRVKAITGRVDLVHCNNSQDEFGSGRDRHAGLESGTIDPALLLDVVRAADAPVICETPDPGADIGWLRQHLR